MATLYKLTDSEGFTRKGSYNECLWGPGITHAGTGHGELCGPGYIHAYTSPLLAVLLNPIHADIKHPRLWECSGVICKSDRGLKVGCKKLTTIEELPLPEISIENCIKFAILCAVAANPKHTVFLEWVKKYLLSKDLGTETEGLLENSQVLYNYSISSAIKLTIIHNYRLNTGLILEVNRSFRHTTAFSAVKSANRATLTGNHNFNLNRIAMEACYANTSE